MTKIFSSELHGNDNAGIEFGAAIVNAVSHVRQQMAILVNSRKADEYAPGAIHALRKLCDGESKSGHIYQIEVEEWRAAFYAWFNRVKRWFPDELATTFQKNADEDFRILLECSSNIPDFFWRSEVSTRHIQISFKNDVELKAARYAADQKHPVQLGSALHNYVETCIAQLVGKELPATAPAPASSLECNNMLCVRFARHPDEVTTLIVDQFHCFNTSEDLAQDIVVTAYDVEDSVKSFVATNSPDTVKDVKFDCESSTFVVLSPNAMAVSNVVAALVRLALDHEQFIKHRSRE